MNTLYVYGDFDWLERPQLIGELGAILVIIGFLWYNWRKLSASNRVGLMQFG